MTPIFDPAFVESHDLYHARYGRGAVVVAIPKDPDPAMAGKRRSRGLHAAGLFNARVPGDTGSAPALEPILSIEEQSGVVRMTMQFEYRYPRTPQRIAVSAVIDRVMPLDRVTLEVVRTDDHQATWEALRERRQWSPAGVVPDSPGTTARTEIPTLPFLV